MSDWDLTIFETQDKKSILNRFKISRKKMTAAGQHGKATVLEDENGKEWLLKTFGNIIDFEVNKIMDLEVDIHESPDEGRHRMHIWRVLNELTASRLAQKLKLNVPKAIVVCSQQIADYSLDASSQLALGDVIILDDEEGTPESAEEYYDYTSRESYTLETSQLFEKVLSDRSANTDSTTVMGLLMEKIPYTMNLDEYLDSHSDDFDNAVQSIREIDDGYFLLPFDIWLNDPDRNAGNYLVEIEEKKPGKPIKACWGIDYEMWSLGSDIWMEEDEITKGRSYLTAIIHPSSNIFDPRVNQTLYRIRNISDEELVLMTRAPQLLCKFFEYHISQQALETDERIVLKQVETNLEDFLSESRPRSDKLSEILIKQIGHPPGFEL